MSVKNHMTLIASGFRFAVVPTQYEHSIGTAILVKSEKTVLSNQLTKFEKRDRYFILLLLPGFQTLFFFFTLLWMCPVQKWTFGRDNFFYKSEKATGQIVQPIKIKTVAFVSYHGHLVFRLFVLLQNFSSPKIKSLHQKNMFSKIGQDGHEIFFAN